MLYQHACSSIQQLVFCDLQMSTMMMTFQATAYLLTIPHSLSSTTPPEPAPALLWSAHLCSCLPCCFFVRTTSGLLLGTAAAVMASYGDDFFFAFILSLHGTYSTMLPVANPHSLSTAVHCIA